MIHSSDVREASRPPSAPLLLQWIHRHQIPHLEVRVKIGSVVIGLSYSVVLLTLLGCQQFSHNYQIPEVRVQSARFFTSSGPLKVHHTDRCHPTIPTLNCYVVLFPNIATYLCLISIPIPLSPLPASLPECPQRKNSRENRCCRDPRSASSRRSVSPSSSAPRSSLRSPASSAMPSSCLTRPPAHNRPESWRYAGPLSRPSSAIRR